MTASASTQTEYNHGPSLAGKGGLILAVVALFLITVITPEGFTPPKAYAPGGFCFSGTDLQLLPGRLMVWLNLGLITLLSLYQILFTRRFNFIPSQNLSYASVFIFCTACLPWAVYRLSTGVAIALLILLSSNILFAVYGRRNASESIFVLFTFLSWGSMIDFAALYLVPVFFVSAIICKAMRFREFVAMLLGLAAPYWIVLATGAVSLQSLRVPEISTFMQSNIEAGSLGANWFYLELLIGAVFFLFLLLLNSLRRAATSARSRAMFAVLNLVGSCLIVLMFIDIRNVQAYCLGFLMMLGYQVGYWTASIAAPKRNIFIGFLFLVSIALFTVCQLLPA